MSMATFAQAKPIRALAVMAGSGVLFRPGSPGAAAADAVVHADEPNPAEYRFSLEGRTFAVTVTRLDQGFRYRIKAPLGEMPFTAESPPARHAILAILDDSRSLDRVRFVIGAQRMLWVVTEAELVEEATPEAVIHETLLFLQQACPYLRLLRLHLPPPAPAGSRAFAAAHGPAQAAAIRAPLKPALPSPPDLV